MSNEHPAAADWAAARGEKWRDHLTGMEATLAPVDDPLIEALRVDRPSRIADLACGGGGTTLAIARRAPAGSVVRGYDISAALVETARARARESASDVAFACVDVATSPPPEAPFDRLASRFGMMFFDDPAAAFANLRGWLAPGGRFAFAVWSHAADNPLMTLPRDAVAELVELPASDPAAPGPLRYADVGVLLALLEGAGFTDLASHDWRGAFAVGGGLPADAAARFALTSFAVAERLANESDEVRAAAHRALVARYTPHEHDGVVRLDASVHLVTGASR